MATIKEMLPSELRERINRGERPLIVDVREPEEVAAGMISGAAHIPLGELPHRHAEIDRNEPTVLVCRSGNRSKRAAEYLQSLGYTNLISLSGGMTAWTAL